MEDHVITVKFLTLPTSPDWKQAKLVSDILCARQLSIQEKEFGPFILILGAEWNSHLDELYGLSIETTLRDRLGQIDQIVEIYTIDALSLKVAILCPEEARYSLRYLEHPK